jgi:hypothetical protein
MPARKIDVILSILSILSILCISPSILKGQSPNTLPNRQAISETSSNQSNVSSEEEISPLPSVSPEPAPALPLGSGKNGQNKQNGKDTQDANTAYSSQPVYEGYPQNTYPPGPLKIFIRHVIEDWRENNLWPNELPESDRQQVHSTMEMIIHNGWRRQNLLSDFHFDPGTGQLNASGQEKLRWILWEVPEKHRLVYVARAVHPSETAARMASVQKAASQLVGDRPLPPILESELSPIGWPASQVDTIQRKYQETTPPPRLKSQSNSNKSQ